MKEQSITAEFRDDNSSRRNLSPWKRSLHEIKSSSGFLDSAFRPIAFHGVVGGGLLYRARASLA